MGVQISEILPKKPILMEDLKGKKIAIEAGQRLLAGSELKIERVTVVDEYQAWLLFQKIEGRGISMVDTSSFVLMRRLKINEVFAFDTDFKTQGFTIYPS